MFMLKLVPFNFKMCLHQPSMSLSFAGLLLLEPIPPVTGREARCTLDRLPVHHRATVHTDIDHYVQFRGRS